MSEKQTRQEIIDKRLKDAGWDVNNPTQVISEHEVFHQFGRTDGVGYSDYVLLGRDGKPLAVVEAKKTSREAEAGREQAKQYANGFEQANGERPFIFYTNGIDIFFWDERYPPRKVFGFFTREDLERIRFQKNERREPSTSLIDRSIVERPYQIEAIRRVCEAFEEKNRRKALVVMATDTGKTRTAMALIDVLMRANWVKRVLSWLTVESCLNRRIMRLSSSCQMHREPEFQVTTVHLTNPFTFQLIQRCTESIQPSLLDSLI